MDSGDPPRFELMVSAVGGAITWGLIGFAAAWRSDEGVTLRHWVHLIGNLVMGVIVGALSAWFLGPSLIQVIPSDWGWAREPHAFGFLFGASAWELAPAAMDKLKRRFADKPVPKEEG